jgi:hypothetical protein
LAEVPETVVEGTDLEEEEEALFVLCSDLICLALVVTVAEVAVVGLVIERKSLEQPRELGMIPEMLFALL